MRSILGQLLFLLYLTGLLSAVERPIKVCLYADEVNVKTGYVGKPRLI